MRALKMAIGAQIARKLNFAYSDKFSPQNFIYVHIFLLVCGRFAGEKEHLSPR